MNTDSFYTILSGICFALCGLWWNVVDSRKEWLADKEMRSLSGGVYASFLIPGVMSLGAQIGGDNKLVWRAIFAVAALLGMFFNVRLAVLLGRTAKTGFFTRSRWPAFLGYTLVLILGIAPELVAFSGFKSIQVEAFLLCIIVLTGHGLAWEMLTRPAIK